MRAIARILILLIVVGVLVGGGYYYYVSRAAAAPVQYRTAKVTRGELLQTISATGTVEPQEVIDVGAQVAGQILSLGTDATGKAFDFGSVVHNGDVIAKIDDAIYQADVTEAQAQLDQAKAGVLKAQADLETMHSKLDQAQRDWERAQQLGPSDALAQSAYDNYKAVYEQAKASIGVGNASLAQANAAVSQAQSTLMRAERNLGYCTIKATVDGTVIKRNVNIGQTVVSSLNTPSLFLVAKDLRRMEVWVAVNEADIGNVHVGQPVSFTVDAFPDRTFHGTVDLVRYDASMTQNVVTYTVEVAVDNSDLRLLPYLTANVQFEVNRAEDALLIPNAALRYTPQTEQVAPDVRSAMANTANDNGPGGEAAGTTQPVEGGMRNGGGGWRNRNGGGGSGGATTEPSTRPAGVRPRPGVVWIKDGQFVRPIQVMAGLSDGVQTVIRGENIDENTEVVVGEQQASADGTGASGQQSTNPFLPQFPRRGGNGGGGGRAGGGGGPGGGGGGGARSAGGGGGGGGGGR